MHLYMRMSLIELFFYDGVIGSGPQKSPVDVKPQAANTSFEAKYYFYEPSSIVSAQ